MKSNTWKEYVKKYTILEVNWNKLSPFAKHLLVIHINNFAEQKYEDIVEQLKLIKAMYGRQKVLLQDSMNQYGVLKQKFDKEVVRTQKLVEDLTWHLKVMPEKMRSVVLLKESLKRYNSQVKTKQKSNQTFVDPYVITHINASEKFLQDNANMKMIDEIAKKAVAHYHNLSLHKKEKKSNMEDFEIDCEGVCPKCDHSPIHFRDCSEIHCQDGVVDENDDDPINFSPGEVTHPCQECKGTGVEWWCPGCGANLSGEKLHQDQDEDLPNYEDED